MTITSAATPDYDELITKYTDDGVDIEAIMAQPSRLEQPTYDVEPSWRIICDQVAKPRKKSTRKRA